jgi:NAD(P)-dependent dehydrogenase (short-subunit alcohol dehydrogenase family)
LVTGASGGFGTLISKTLLKEGHKVVGSMRGANARNKESAKALKDAGAHIVEIDVTDDASVERGVTEAQEAVGGLDAVVNNAGAGTLGLQETFSPEDWRRVFDINVFGVQRVNRAVLPDMRAKGSGLLIHISSLLGRFVLPFLGPYNASKYALEALADNYRVELSGIGVDSVVVEPGGYGTTFHDSILQPSDTDRTASYGEYAQAPHALMESFQQNFSGADAPDPQDVADAVTKLVRTPAGERPFRTVVDGLGMGEPIEALNRGSEEATAGIYNAFGMGEMLKLRTLT